MTTIGQEILPINIEDELKQSEETIHRMGENAFKSYT